MPAAGGRIDPRCDGASGTSVVYVYDPKANPDYSRIISAREVSRLAALIDPAKVVIGGQSDADARYLDPTILYLVSWDDPIIGGCRDGLRHATDLTDDPVKCLAHLIHRLGELADLVFLVEIHSTGQIPFGNPVEEIGTLTERLGHRPADPNGQRQAEQDAGGGAANQVNIHLFVVTMPFGGVGSAGMGHYYGKYGYDMLTHAKSMLISPPDMAIEHLFPPYSPEKNAELKLWFEY